MTIRKNNVIIFTIIIILVTSCKTTNTYNRKNPYPNMEVVHYGNGHAYVFRNGASDKLLIIIEGMGWTSVLGFKNEKQWEFTGTVPQLLQVLSDKYSIMVLEKLNRQPGQNYYEDMEDRENYTADKLLDCYVKSINGYLAGHSFSSVVIAGFSEGACLLPLVYERIKNKDKVKALVSMGFGGFSWYESIYMLSLRQNLPPERKKTYQYIAGVYKPGDDDYPDSYHEDVFGITYRWLNSFVNIELFDYYKNIKIPVLFIHGSYDFSIPVESTMYVQENLPEKPFTYKYFPWDYQPRKRKHVITWRNELAEWVLNVDR